MKKDYKYITAVTEDLYMYIRPEDTPAYEWCEREFGFEDNEFFSRYYAGWKYLGNGKYGFKSKYKHTLFTLLWK